MIQQLIQQFNEHFENDDVPYIYFAPSQINLMGDHADYHKGLALPIALSSGTYAVIQRRDDEEIHLYATHEQHQDVTCRLDRLTYQPTHRWANYPKGLIYLLKKAGFMIDTGFDIMFVSDVPEHRGLSVTATMEMVTAIAINDLYDLNIDELELIQYCKRNENSYIGANKGIIRHYASSFGKRDQALFVDHQTLDMEHIPVNMDQHCFLMVNIKEQPPLEDTVYNNRGNECVKALQELQMTLPIKSLSELTMETLANAKHLLHDELSQRRVKYIVSENERTRQAAHFLHQNEMNHLGKIMNASHSSLQHDYEVTDVYLDVLIAIAQKQTGVLGAKMLGGGFGACALLLIEKDYLLSIQKRMQDQFNLELGKSLDIYEVEIGNSAREMVEGEF